MIKFYIPLYYLINTRLKTKMEIFSWNLIFILPQFLITSYYLNYKLDFFFLIFFISQLIFHSLYEIGYIENDIKTVNKEKNPTIRLDKKSFFYVKNNYINIISWKYFTITIFLIVLHIINLNQINEIFFYPFIILLIINRLFFYFHNKLRNRFNIISFFMLATLKYIFPLLLFVDVNTLLYPVLLSVITFPLLRTIEICTLKRFNFKNFSKKITNLDKFRILYYLTFSVIIIIGWYFSIINNKNFYITILIFTYFSLYRISTYLLIKRGIYKRDVRTNKQYPLK